MRQSDLFGYRGAVYLTRLLLVGFLAREGPPAEDPRDPELWRNHGASLSSTGFLDKADFHLHYSFLGFQQHEWKTAPQVSLWASPFLLGAHIFILQAPVLSVPLSSPVPCLCYMCPIFFQWTLVLYFHTFIFKEGTLYWYSKWT